MADIQDEAKRIAEGIAGAQILRQLEFHCRIERFDGRCATQTVQNLNTEDGEEMQVATHELQRAGISGPGRKHFTLKVTRFDNGSTFTEIQPGIGGELSEDVKALLKTGTGG